MPNWCDNVVLFDSSETCSRARQLMETALNGFDFEALRPRPDRDSGEYNTDWCHDNWGTKWNASGVRWGDNSVLFHTPWAPPIPILEDLSKKLGCAFDFVYSVEADGDYKARVNPYAGFEVQKSSRKRVVDALVDNLGLEAPANEEAELDW